MGHFALLVKVIFDGFPDEGAHAKPTWMQAFVWPVGKIDGFVWQMIDKTNLNQWKWSISEQTNREIGGLWTSSGLFPFDPPLTV